MRPRWPAALGLALALAVPVACSSGDGGSLDGLGLPDTTPFRTTLVEVITTTTAPPTTEGTPTSATPASTGATAPVTDAPGTYTVRDGDAWYLIADRLGVDVQDLLDANAATVDTAIFPGKVLVVPTGTASPGTTGTTAPEEPADTTAPPAAGGTYTVQDGDYWLGIAQKLGVDLDDLLAANDATTGTAIFPGDVIQVPG